MAKFKMVKLPDGVWINRRDIKTISDIKTYSKVEYGFEVYGFEVTRFDYTHGCITQPFKFPSLTQKDVMIKLEEFIDAINDK